MRHDIAFFLSLWDGFAPEIIFEEIYAQIILAEDRD